MSTWINTCSLLSFEDVCVSPPQNLFYMAKTDVSRSVWGRHCFRGQTDGGGGRGDDQRGGQGRWRRAQLWGVRQDAHLGLSWADEWKLTFTRRSCSSKQNLFLFLQKCCCHDGQLWLVSRDWSVPIGPCDLPPSCTHVKTCIPITYGEKTFAQWTRVLNISISFRRCWNFSKFLASFRP